MRKIYLSTFVIFFLANFILCQESKELSDAKGLKIGDTIPSITTVDEKGDIFEIQNVLNQSPVVLIFFRGAWCPLCNRHLGAIQDSLSLIYEKGAQVIAISPEHVTGLDSLKNASNIKFTLLHDKDNKIATLFDVNFIPKDEEVEMYNTHLDAKLEKGKSELPVPATYIINQNGIVDWVFFNPDYRKRATVKEIIENL